MPEPYALWRSVADGWVSVGRGPRLLCRFQVDDIAMRNLSLVALTDAGVKGKDLAALFSITPEHLSRLRTRVSEEGSAGLIKTIGRPRSLSTDQLEMACKLLDEGNTYIEIAHKLNVSRYAVSRALKRAPRPEPTQLPLGEEAGIALESSSLCGEEGSAVGQTQDEDEGLSGSSNISRIEDAEVSSCYAGAMLLHHFFDRISVGKILSSLPRTAARRYDALHVVLSATFGFALGSSSAEGTKHLHRRDAGALIGLESFPELRTLRPRLAAIAEASDPHLLQVAFAKAMLDADEEPPKLYFCDDHFVTYTGARPVAKGYNTRKRRAEKGRDDTFIVDSTWRAMCFSSSEPKGLSVNLPPVIDQLIEICGDRPVMVGFDRGGSYPKVFSALKERGVGWVTYRRAPLAASTVAPKISWVEVDHKRVLYHLADEIVELKGYGQARQLSLYENDKIVFQVLTSDTTLNGARLLRALRARWRIENTFKYAQAHHGINWLCSYEMDEVPDNTVVANPARLVARSERKQAQDTLKQAKEALGDQCVHPSSDIDDHLALITELKDSVGIAEENFGAATAALTGIPARLSRDEIHPGAIRAKPHLERRGLQMVCRLLAYNAELDLARRINAYLGDDDEYRGITRNLLHLGGTISFGRRGITVHLDRPDQPRLRRALALLIEEINNEPPHLPGDGRPITYVLRS